MKRNLFLFLIFLSLFTILASLNFPLLLWNETGFLESGTYDLLDCDANYLRIIANDTICVSAYDMKLRPLGSTHSGELRVNVTQPLIKAEGNLKFSLKRGRSFLNKSYWLTDESVLIPTEKGYYELLIMSEDVEVFDMEKMKPVDLKVERVGREIYVYCRGSGSSLPLLGAEPEYKVLLSGDRVRYEVEAYGYAPNPLLLLLGLVMLVGAFIYARKREGGESEQASGGAD